MMRTHRQRVFLAVAITLLAALLGVGAGYLLGGAITLHLAEGRLQQYAERILAVGDASSQESRLMLTALNSSPYPYCSDAEIAYFRKLIFQSEYMRDAGRMRAGKIDCSATMGRLTPPVAIPAPSFQQQDGINAYSNLAPAGAPGPRGLGIQLGDSYVVFGGYIMKHLDSLPMHYTISVFGARDRQSRWMQGALSGASDAVLSQEGHFRLRRTLYATSCSPRFFHCVTAYMTTPEALQADHGQLKFNACLGGLTGGCFGFLFALLFRRSQSMERQLLRSIRQGDLQVVYQPIVEMTTRRIIGAEALCRWRNEHGLTVAPEVFIAIAEEGQFVNQITHLVVRRVLQEMGELMRLEPQLHVHVNVTAMDLCDDAFLPMLENQLQQAGVAASSLMIEVTESSTARSPKAKETIQALRQRGHSIQIDDFGTGYSSLSYLQDLAIDGIKIDKSFTLAIGTEAVTVGIIPLILAMAESLHLQVTVEGVETAQQAAYFVLPGAEKPFLGQGWLYGRPMPVQEFSRLLEEARLAANLPVDVT
jgi:sensor c-di-GMP phosphodiesterase-like protein